MVARAVVVGCRSERTALHVDVRELGSGVFANSFVASKQGQQQEKKQELKWKSVLQHLGWWPSVTTPEACFDRPGWHHRRTRDAFHQAHPCELIEAKTLHDSAASSQIQRRVQVACATQCPNVGTYSFCFGIKSVDQVPLGRGCLTQSSDGLVGQGIVGGGVEGQRCRLGMARSRGRSVMPHCV